MESSQSNPKPGASSGSSSLDSLRTVEFRQSLKGYNMIDVDDYIDRVAAEAEALQEQHRQQSERLRQAADRVVQLEQQVEHLRRQMAAGPPTQATPAATAAAPTDDTLQRTLVLAQKFVDQTKADAEEQARQTVGDAEERARKLLADAEEHMRAMSEEAERSLRDEVTRLHAAHGQLKGDVEQVARHLDGERQRLRDTLSEMLTWVDEHLQPAPTLLGQRPAAATTPSEPAPSEPALPPSPPFVASDESPTTESAPQGSDEGGPARQATPGPARPASVENRPPGQRQMFTPSRESDVAHSGTR